MARPTLLLVTLLLFTLTPALAQDGRQTERPIKPVDLPMSFSGNYGELRHNHFHQGLDWRVGGKVGDPIHAIKSGYVSQVSVSNTGYGNAVYICHYDGTMSVYGHMLRFREDIAARVKEAQYERESFEVTVAFQPDEFPLEQGDVFGRVGNTGSSGGPHLHMEVRDTEKNLPMNYLSMGYYSVEDNLAPRYMRVAFYGLDTLTIPNAYRIAMIRNPLSWRKTVRLPHKSYVAMDAHDVQDGTTGKLAVEEYKVILDEKEIFHFKIGDVGFTEGRYIKSMRQNGEAGADLIKSRMDPSNLLSDRVTAVNDGLIVLDDFNEHNLRLEAMDGFGNRSVIRMTVRRDDSVSAPSRKKDTTAVEKQWLWYTPNVIDCDEFSYILPLGALYNNANVLYRKVAERDSSAGILTNVWEISSESTPLHKNGRIRFNVDIPEELAGKTFMANWNNGRLTLSGENVGFGRYCLATDTEAPEITMDRNGRIRVRDDRSGVGSIRVEIDGEWHLFKFYRGIVTILDRESIRRGSHKIKVAAIDNCGNRSEFTKTVKF